MFADCNQYCLFGDTVNTASRIESSSEAQMVQISEMTKGMLAPNEWDIYERGTIPLKGKGFMKTYWLYGRKPDMKPKSPINALSRGDGQSSCGESASGSYSGPLLRTGSDPGSEPKWALTRSPPINASESQLQAMNNSFERQLKQLIKENGISDDINIDRSALKTKNIEKSSSLLTSRREERVNTITNTFAIDRRNKEPNDKTDKNASADYGHKDCSQDQCQGSANGDDQGCFACASNLSTDRKMCNLC